MPLAPAVIAAMHEAVEEMGKKETFKGYGPEQGYPFLRESIKGYYARRGVTLNADEIFVSDGSKSDCGNILDIFAKENTVLVPDPVYPVYVDTNVMAGRKIVYAAATEENGFCPCPTKIRMRTLFTSVPRTIPRARRIRRNSSESGWNTRSERMR